MPINRYASFPEPSDDWQSGPITTYAPLRPNPTGAALRNPFETSYPRLGGEGGADRGYMPAKTVNAVTASLKAREDEDIPNYPTEYRRGYDQGVVAGRPQLRGPAPSDGQPYPGAPARFVAPAGDGYPMPRFNAVSSDVGDQSDLFLPGFQTKLAEYQSEADQRFKTGGLVDNWLGRQALKRRSRLVADAERIAGVKLAGRDAVTRRLATNAAVARAQNEVPLAQLADTTQRRGQDLTTALGVLRNDTERYGIDTQATTSRENSERALLPHLSDVVYGQQMANAVAAGDLEGAEDIAVAFGKRNPRQLPDSKMEIAPDGKTVLIGARPGELPRAVPIEDLIKKNKERQNALAKDLYPSK